MQNLAPRPERSDAKPPALRCRRLIRTYMAMYRSAPLDLFKRYQYLLRQLFIGVRSQIPGGLLGEAVRFDGVHLGESGYLQLAGCSVKHKLAPIALVVGLVAVRAGRDALDAYDVQLTELNEIQRQLFHGSAVGALCGSRA